MQSPVWTHAIGMPHRAVGTFPVPADTTHPHAGTSVRGRAWLTLLGLTCSIWGVCACVAVGAL